MLSAPNSAPWLDLICWVIVSLQRPHTKKITVSSFYIKSLNNSRAIFYRATRIRGNIPQFCTVTNPEDGSNEMLSLLRIDQYRALPDLKGLEMKLLIAAATAALVSTTAFASTTTIGLDARPNAGGYEVNDTDTSRSNPASIKASTNDNNSRATAGMNDAQSTQSNSGAAFSTRGGIAGNGDAYPEYSR